MLRKRREVSQQTTSRQDTSCVSTRVKLIDFVQGSDWSLPCKRMFFLLFEDKSCKETIEQYYEYLLLDAEREQNFPILKKLGDPQYLGFPVFVIIDAYGRYIHSQATGDLEKDPAFMSHAGPDPKKILKFLMRWREDGMADKELGTLDPVQD